MREGFKVVDVSVVNLKDPKGAVSVLRSNPRVFVEERGGNWRESRRS